MITSERVFRMEKELYDSLSEEYKDIFDNGTEDDEAVFKAYAAVQDLRLYLERRSSNAE